MELKVVQQMQSRLIAHRMRNLQLKLTPKQKTEKKLRKLQEDVSHGVFVAVFRVTDFSCSKYRFKVDVFAQQWFLSGLALLNLETQSATQNAQILGSNPDTQNNLGLSSVQQNLIVVEGGAKSIKKFIKLLTKRIDWTRWIPSNIIAHPVTATSGEGGGFNYDSNAAATATAGGADDSEGAMQVEEEEDTEADASNAAAGNEDSAEGGTAHDNEAEEDDNDSSSSSDSEDNTHHHLTHPSHQSTEIEYHPHARCDLLWSGMLPKRQFQGFKFQEARNSSAARKALEGKGLQHYWDMVVQADTVLKGQGGGAGSGSLDTDWLM